jgi:hypothetical protein
MCQIPGCPKRFKTNGHLKDHLKTKAHRKRPHEDMSAYIDDTTSFDEQENELQSKTSKRVEKQKSKQEYQRDQINLDLLKEI